MSTAFIKASVSISEIDGFDAAIDEVMAAVDQNLDEVAEVMFQSAKTTSAFADKTGMLRRAIKKEKKGKSYYRVSARAPHAYNVEFGHGLIAWGRVPKKTKFVRGRSFLRKAKELALVRAVEIFRQR